MTIVLFTVHACPEQNLGCLCIVCSHPLCLPLIYNYNAHCGLWRARTRAQASHSLLELKYCARLTLSAASVISLESTFSHLLRSSTSFIAILGVPPCRVLQFCDPKQQVLSHFAMYTSID